MYKKYAKHKYIGNYTNYNKIYTKYTKQKIYKLCIIYKIYKYIQNTKYKEIIINTIYVYIQTNRKQNISKIQIITQNIHLKYTNYIYICIL